MSNNAAEGSDEIIQRAIVFWPNLAVAREETTASLGRDLRTACSSEGGVGQLRWLGPATTRRFGLVPHFFEVQIRRRVSPNAAKLPSIGSAKMEQAVRCNLRPLDKVDAGSCMRVGSRQTHPMATLRSPPIEVAVRSQVEHPGSSVKVSEPYPGLAPSKYLLY